MYLKYGHDTIEHEALKCIFLCASCNQRKTDLETAAKLFYTPVLAGGGGGGGV
jgi:hypothetical protein